jgi:HD-like signal output (HDOD) protein
MRQAVEGWISKLAGSGLPVFSETVREVSGLATQRESSARDLASAIGRDASLAARLLKIANSPLFNLQNRNIETISSAVVLIGFDAIRELAVSLALIEHVLKGRQHARVTQSMSRAFHAAAQARSLAVSQKDKCPEEVFVAALLLHVGEMAFWSVADEEAAAIERMTRSGSSLEEAEQRVLGFHLEALTRRLVEDWHLGALLEQAVAGKHNPRVASVELGHAVAAAVEQFGWDSAEVRQTVDKVAVHLGVPWSAAEELVQANVEEAAEIATRYGVPAVETYLQYWRAVPPRP